MITNKLTPDIGQARTLADYQQLLYEMGRQVVTKAKPKKNRLHRV